MSDADLITDAHAEAAGVRAKLVAASGRVEVGEPLRVRLEVQAPPEMAVRLPSAAAPGAPRPMLGEFELRAARLLPTDSRTPGLQVQELDFVSFAAGLQELPPIPIRRGGTDGGEVLAVGPLRIEVLSLMGEVDDPREALRPVKDPLDMALPGEWLPWLLAGVGALAVAACALLLMRRLRRPAPPVIISAEEEAREALGALRRDALPSQGRVLDFYVRLSDIVRRYVERRFGIRAPEQTTQEFLVEASRHPMIVEGHQVLLAGFLRTADRVKFAAERPAEGECARAFDAASGFVDETAERGTPGTPDNASEVRR
ncbi:MAG: hypothetical protein KF724_03945 [Phycisphaeraceae bacterium]|nr:hypothetical protein [Phycisphaeraceae bacterium]